MSFIEKSSTLLNPFSKSKSAGVRHGGFSFTGMLSRGKKTTGIKGSLDQMILILIESEMLEEKLSLEVMDLEECTKDTPSSISKESMWLFPVFFYSVKLSFKL